MRLILVAASIAVLGLAGTAAAQPVSPLPEQAQPVGSPKADPQKASSDADKALAMTIRAQQEQAERIARIACAAGDKEKCAQLEKLATTAKTPSP